MISTQFPKVLCWFSADDAEKYVVRRTLNFSGRQMDTASCISFTSLQKIQSNLCFVSFGIFIARHEVPVPSHRAMLHFEENKGT